MNAEMTQEAATKLWCDNPEHAEAGSAVPAIYRVTWPDGRFRPALACKDCLEDSLSLYVLNGDSDGRRHPALIELAVPVTEDGEVSEPDEIVNLKAERDEAQSEAAMIRSHANRYFRARYGPDYIYRAPETFENVLEQWIWAIGAGVPELAHSSIGAIERFFAGRDEAADPTPEEPAP